VNDFLGFSGLLVLFALLAEIKTICGFNHTVNNMVHADKTLHVVYIYIHGPYSVIIRFSSSYYNDYDAGGRVLPLDHY